MARPKRKEAEVEQTRRHIAFSAAAVFAEKGYNSTSMAELATAAGYSTPSLYKYFSGKEAIVSWLDETLNNEILELFAAEYPASLNFRQRLELFLQSLLNWMGERRSAYAFQVCESKSPKESIEFIHGFATWIDENSSLKERCGMSAFECAVALNGLGHSHFVVWFETKQKQPQYLHDLLAFFFAGMEGCKAR